MFKNELIANMATARV
jgi:hypothetical protein